MKKMKWFVITILLSICAINFTGCASIMTPRQQRTELTSMPSLAAVKVYDEDNRLVLDSYTPTTFSPNARESRSYRVIFEREGYFSQTHAIKSRANWWLSLLNIPVTYSLTYFPMEYMYSDDPSVHFLALAVTGLVFAVDGFSSSYARVFPKTVHANLDSEINIYHDRISLKNGNRINAIVIEVSSREIRYRLANQPEGPVRVISTSSVTEILYQDRSIDNFANKAIFGVSIDPSGFALSGPEGGFEITKGNINTQIQLRFPSAGAQNSDLSGGFGIGLNVNYIQNGRSGGFYAGGIGEYSTWKTGDEYSHNGAFAGNIGYRFAGESGMNFSLGASVGGRFGDSGATFIWRPVTSVGYSF